MFYILAYIVVLSLLIYGLLGLTFYKRLFFTALFAVITISGPLIYYDTLSRAKSVQYEFFENPKEARIIAKYVEPNYYLALLLQWDNKEPRYYKYPWNKEVQKLAEQLQEAERKGMQMMLELPFEKSLERDIAPRAHPIPQLKMPDKPEPKQQGKEYNL